jgi:type III pantothenate kinase
MKTLAIDSGNTRLKFAVFENGAAGSGAQSIANLALPEASWKEVLAAHGQPERIIVSNVAGERMRGVLASSLQLFSATPTWIRAQANQCGVTNRYENPGQLGSDRWAALIGAWAREKNACLVVNMGTATTVDALSANGEFLGGLILPGFELMRESLAKGTAALTLADGKASAFPRNTADAIWNGCVMAQAGAIERMRGQLPESANCLISGGAAPLLLPALNMQCIVVDNLVLEGLARIAAE